VTSSVRPFDVAETMPTANAMKAAKTPIGIMTIALIFESDRASHRDFEVSETQVSDVQ
jgi:hypothetical protein